MSGGCWHLRAEKVLQRELGTLGWKETELGRRRKGDPEKVEIAWCLHQETHHDIEMDCATA
jgi:hypothetical protein